VSSQGGLVPMIGGSGAPYRGSGAHYAGVWCPLYGGQVPVNGIL
jgi:hypothetical protein